MVIHAQVHSQPRLSFVAFLCTLCLISLRPGRIADKMDELDFYYAGIVGWQLHPGYQREGSKPMTLHECFALAQRMLEVKNECLGSAEQSWLAPVSSEAS